MAGAVKHAVCHKSSVSSAHKASGAQISESGPYNVYVLRMLQMRWVLELMLSAGGLKYCTSCNNK